jgi:hypothetical protein
VIDPISAFECHCLMFVNTTTIGHTSKTNRLWAWLPVCDYDNPRASTRAYSPAVLLLVSATFLLVPVSTRARRGVSTAARWRDEAAVKLLIVVSVPGTMFNRTWGGGFRMPNAGMTRMYALTLTSLLTCASSWLPWAKPYRGGIRFYPPRLPVAVLSSTPSPPPP